MFTFDNVKACLNQAINQSFIDNFLKGDETYYKVPGYRYFQV